MEGMPGCSSASTAMADETEEHLLPEFDVHLQAFSIAAAEGEAAATAYRLRQLRTVVAAEGGASRRRHPLPNIYWGQDATEQLKAAHREIVGHCASSASQLQPLAVRQLRTALEDDTAAAATAAAAAAAGPANDPPPPPPPPGDGGAGGGIGAVRSTGNHCGGHAAGWSASSASLLAALGGVVMCGVNAAQKTAATPMRTGRRRLRVGFFAYVCMRWDGVPRCRGHKAVLKAGSRGSMRGSVTQ